MLCLKNLTAVLAVCVIVTGCSTDSVTGNPKSPSPSIQVAQTPQELSADLVARGFAAAMSDPSLRLAVRDAMRGSLLTEHKLGLQEFLQTPSGAALAAA